MFKIFERKQVRNMVELILGALVLAMSVKFFIIPTGISAGGVSGLATILYVLFGWSIPIVVWVINFSILLVSGLILGKDIVIKSIVGSIVFPLFLAILPDLDLTGGDHLLGMIIGGMITGIASYLIFSSGGSTGGTSLPPFILKKYFNISLVTGLTIIDGLTLGANIFTGKFTNIFYGLLSIIIMKIVVDYLESGMKKRKSVHIISDEYQAIMKYIHESIGRGTTLLEAKGGYSQKDKPVILTIVSSRELHLIRAKVMEMDSNAFLIIGSVSEVHGYGFTRPKALTPDKELEFMEGLQDV